MKQLYYMRHGESYINTGDTWADTPGAPEDIGLTELGRTQARDGAEQAKLRGVTFDHIICSPLLRTKETAAIVADVFGFPVGSIEYSDLLLEIQVGPELEGTAYSAFIAKHTYADFDQFKGAETIEKLQERAALALEYAQSLHAENILIVSHSCFGRAFRRNIEGRPFSDEFSTDNHTVPFAEIIQLI